MERLPRVSALLAAVLLLGGCGTTSTLTGTAPVGDATPPAVTAALPAPEATVPAEAHVSVTFSKPMNTRSATVASDPPVAFGPAEWSADERTVSFKPQATLSPGTRYTVTVTAQDKAGNPPVTHRWTFTAGAPGARAGAGAARVAQRVEVRADRRVFTLFAALNAAGYDAGAEESGEVRRAVRAASADLPVRAVDPVRTFWREHPRPLEAYVRYVLDLGEPPAFAEQRAPQGLERLNRVLAAFYESARVEALWSAHRPAYEAAAAAAAAEGPKVIGAVLDYARSSELPAERIVLIPNLLDDPAAGYLIRQPRWVVFVFGWRDRNDAPALTSLAAGLALETLPEVAAPGLRRTEPLFPLVRETAQREGWTSWERVVRESLIAAVTARLALPEERRAGYLRRQYARGLILVDHFARELVRYERGTAPLGTFLAEMLAAVDLAEEQRVFASRRP